MSTSENPISFAVYAKDNVPVPPKDAEVLTTACDYCTIACGYKVYRWPVGKEGGVRAKDNALKTDLPSGGVMVPWASPSQHNVVRHRGRPHHVLVLPDFQATVVNPGGGPLDPRRHAGTEVLQPREPHLRAPALPDDPGARNADAGVVGSRDRRDGGYLEVRPLEVRRARVGHQDVLVSVFREHLCNHQARHDLDRHAGDRAARQTLRNERCHRAGRCGHQLLCRLV